MTNPQQTINASNNLLSLNCIVIAWQHRLTSRTNHKNVLASTGENIVPAGKREEELAIGVSRCQQDAISCNAGLNHEFRDAGRHRIQELREIILAVEMRSARRVISPCPASIQVHTGSSPRCEIHARTGQQISRQILSSPYRDTW